MCCINDFAECKAYLATEVEQKSRIEFVNSWLNRYADEKNITTLSYTNGLSVTTSNYIKN